MYSSTVGRIVPEWNRNPFFPNDCSGPDHPMLVVAPSVISRTCLSLYSTTYKYLPPERTLGKKKNNLFFLFPTICPHHLHPTSTSLHLFTLLLYISIPSLHRDTQGFFWIIILGPKFILTDRPSASLIFWHWKDSNRFISPLLSYFGKPSAVLSPLPQRFLVL